MEWVEGDETELSESVLWMVEVEGERFNDSGWILMCETECWAEAFDEAYRLHAEDGRAVRVRHRENEAIICDLFINEEVVSA